MPTATVKGGVYPEWQGGTMYYVRAGQQGEIKQVNTGTKTVTVDILTIQNSTEHSVSELPVQVNVPMDDIIGE